MENLISYNGAPWMYTGNLLEFCGSQLRSNEALPEAKNTV
jgi:hypothetical protein